MMKNKKLGIYIHIPFCARKCNYCDFLSAPETRETKERYLSLLDREMRLYKEIVSAREADTLFIGGGTPSFLETDLTDKLLCSVKKWIPSENLKEFTIECNPNSVTEEKLNLYKEAGVTRISLGMQSACDEELKKLGRLHSVKEVEKTYEMVRKHGFERVNIDVMAAIPGQTIESYKHTLEYVVGLSPEHISSYSLIIEEGTPFYEKYRENPPVDEDTDRQMYDLTKEILGRHGYHRYEISNYAKEGQECIHNLKYWQGGDYLGLGLGAASCMEHERWSNARGLTDYEDRICRGQKPVEQTEELGEEEQKAEFMFLGLRCMEGVSAERFEKKFHQSVEERYGKVLHKYENMGLMRLVNGNWQLTEQGIDVSNHIFADFLPE